jgi:uncharacterized delta-60 repeat protein
VVLVARAEVYSQSALDGFDPGTNAQVFAVAVQSSDGKIVVGGSFTSIGGGGTGNTARSRIARLNRDGTLDTAFDPGASPNQVSALAVQSFDGKIIVGGDFSFLGGGGFGTTPRSKIGRLNPDGTIDTSFDPGANGSISAILLQQDGKILIGGSFTMVGGGGSGTTARSRIARLNLDGSIDTSFNPGANNTVRAFALQKDGKIIVAGSFTTLGGGGTGTVQRRSIARLNSDGSLDPTFDPGADDTINAVVIQADGKIVAGGDFKGLGGGTGTTTRNFIGRVNPDGTLDAFNPGADLFVSALALQPDGGILVGGLFQNIGGGGTGTVSRSHLARLKPDGSVDMDFNPGSEGLPHAFALQLDRKIIVGGAFSKLGQLSGGPASRNNIARLYPDGSVDATLFLLPNAAIFAIALQADGKILIGGKFSMIGEVFRSAIARLNPDGRIDHTFSVMVLEAQGFSIGEVDAIAVQPDGKIVIGGKFSSLLEPGGVDTPRKNIARLNSNGAIDTSFDPGANDVVRSLVVQPDGKIVAGGRFTALGAGGTTSRNRIGRLNSDGSIDNTFDPGANDQVNALALQRDGKILIGGNFTMVGGGGTGTTTRNFLARLNSDTSVDLAFNPGANATVSAFALQPDDKIIVAGGFTLLGGGGFGTSVRNRVGRLNPGGDVDAGYVAGANGVIKALALQADGKLIVGGSFSTLGEGAGTKNRDNIGRFLVDGSVDENFDPGTDGENAEVDGLAIQSDGKIIVSGEFLSVGSSGGFRNIGRLTTNDLTAQLIFAGPTSIVWLNFGVGPEVARVTFESSTDGVNFTFLGAGVPTLGRSITAAWHLDGLSLPLSQRLFLRVRSFFQTGQETGSSSIVEVVNHTLFCPAVTVGPAFLSEGVAGSPYTQQFNQTGGTGSISFTRSDGVLPAGLLLNSSTGLLSGTPTESGTFEFTIEATDQNGCFGKSVYTLQIKTGINLSQPVYSTSEGVNVLTITANRVGDVSGPATVNYATSDTAGLTNCTVANGKASERCDYGTTVGTLRFAAGESSKSFFIPIVDDALVEGVETFTVTLSAATGAILGTPQTALLRIVDNDFAPATQNPIDGVEFFVTQQYIDFLGRLPDSIGFANWVATLNGCPNNGFGEFDNPDCDRVHVSAGFFLSIEFQQRGYFAYRFYEVALDRRPTYAEFVPDMAQVGGPQSPDSEVLSKAAYTDAWMQRPEFKSRYDGLSNAAYVNALEANAEVPISNKATLIAALDGGTMNRGQVLRNIVENTAVANQFFNRAFVTMQYFGYLRRDPDTIGFQNWLNTLNADSSNFRHMIFGFIYSTEYRQRFGP